MTWSSRIGRALPFATALLLAPTVARAQAPSPEIAPAPTTLAMQFQENRDRETLRQFIEREDVRRVARLADLDVERMSSGILALEGEKLNRAANQARAIESRLGAQDTITISATTLIIILLLVLLIVVVAS